MAHIVWAHVVVDVITWMHVRIVWADLIVRHMGLSNSGPIGFGWLICSGSAYCVYAMPTLSARRMSSNRGYCLPRFDVFGRLMRSAFFYAVAPFLYSACLFWVNRAKFICCDACAGGYNHVGLLSLYWTYVTVCHRLL